MVVEHSAVAADDRGLVPADLPRAGLAPDLRDGFQQRRHSPQVVRGQLAAAGVGGQRPAGCQRSAGGELAAFALAAEAVVLQRDQDGVGVAVVNLPDVDVCGSQPGLLVRRGARRRRAGDELRDRKIASPA